MIERRKERGRRKKKGFLFERKGRRKGFLLWEKQEERILYIFLGFAYEKKSEKEFSKSF